MPIRRLTPQDAAAFHAMRLQALQESPSAFGASYEDERDFPLALIESRLAVLPDRGPFGAFEDGVLAGAVGLGREPSRKMVHKAVIWGMYVRPAFRGRGIGRALLLQALALARSVPEIRQVTLRVNASNPAAVRLYESLGFQAFGREPDAMRVDGVLHDELHMWLRLPDAG